MSAGVMAAAAGLKLLAELAEKIDNEVLKAKFIEKIKEQEKYIDDLEDAVISDRRIISDLRIEIEGLKELLTR